MSLHSFSFSHRANERRLQLQSIQDHKFIFNTRMLVHMFTNPAHFIEMGGIFGLAYALRTDTQGGIRADEEADNYQKRRATYGTNHYPLPSIKPFMQHVWENLVEDLMLKVLIVCGVVSIATGVYVHPSSGWIEGFAILVCVAIVLFVGAYNNHKQEVEYRKLAASLKGAPASVVRGGKNILIEQDEILVGDIVFLSPGNMIPADGVIVDNTTVRVNESALTGESDEMEKNLNHPFMFAGTELVDGSCSMLVTTVGINSAKGKIMASLAVESEMTDLQKRLAASEKLAGFVGLVCGCATFLALFIPWAAGGPNWSKDWTRIIDIFITSITVVIVAVPEGLPLAVTISMAYSMNKMREDQNLVKVLSACETMGNATTICSDKTGTLTQNKMTVVQTYVGEQYFTRQPLPNEVSLPVHQLLVEGIVLNSDRRIPEEKINYSVAAEDWPWEGEGGATESALLSWLSRYYNPLDPATTTYNNAYKYNLMSLRQVNREKVITFLPFSSAKKYSASVIGEPVQDPEDPEKLMLPRHARMYFKGAADRVIKRCTRYINMNGEAVDVPYPNKSLELTDRPGPGVDGMCQFTRGDETCDKWALLGQRGTDIPICCGDPLHRPSQLSADDMILIENHPLKIMDNMTRVGLRCIAFAYVDNVPIELKDGQLVDPDESQGEEWTLIGLVGIKDPLRVETKAAVMTIQQAGIIVRMVTGDNLDTARFIAKDCGIISHPRQIALEGVDFRKRLEENEAYKAKNGEDNPDFIQLVTDLRVMARCHPEDKLELVKFLKEHDQIVGVTGDGSNDGPALKAANVGLAMGIAGTDVSKAAADIIILDDNFSSIVRSVMWGRSVFDNIRKFLQFQLSVNVCAIVVALLGAIVLGKEPLKPIQLLWVNLVMDTMGALGIGTEIPKPELLLRKPYRPGSSLISKIMFRNIIGQAVCQLALLLPLLFVPDDMFHKYFYTNSTFTDDIDHVDDLLNSFIFNSFVFMQLFNEINSRKCNDELNPFNGIFDNAWFSVLWIISAVFQVFIIEFFGVFMGTTPLPGYLWLMSLIFGVTQLATGFILKLFVIDRTEGQIYLPETTFENAEWKTDESLLGAMFKTYAAKDLRDSAVDSSDATRNVYIGSGFSKQGTPVVFADNAVDSSSPIPSANNPNVVGPTGVLSSSTPSARLDDDDDDDIGVSSHPQ